MEFSSCIMNRGRREREYENMLLQSRLVEEISQGSVSKVVKDL